MLRYVSATPLDGFMMKFIRHDRQSKTIQKMQDIERIIKE